MEYLTVIKMDKEARVTSLIIPGFLQRINSLENVIMVFFISCWKEIQVLYEVVIHL